MGLKQNRGAGILLHSSGESIGCLAQRIVAHHRPCIASWAWVRVICFHNKRRSHRFVHLLTSGFGGGQIETVAELTFHGEQGQLGRVRTEKRKREERERERKKSSRGDLLGPK